MALEAPVVRLVNLLIDEAVGADASDIHVEPFEESLRVRYRIDGLLYDQEAPPRRLQAAVISRIKIMAELNIAERRLPQDGRIRLTARAPGRHPRLDACPPSTARRRDAAARPVVRVPALRPPRASARATRRGARRASSASPTAWCSSPVPPAAARRPRSTPRSTRSTRRSGRSSPSRTRSSTSSRASTRFRCSPQIGLTFASGLRAHRAAGPGRHHGGRDPRPGDGGDRHPGGAHRPPRLLHAAHQRRRRRGDPAAGHGRRAVPRLPRRWWACSPSGSCAASAPSAGYPTAPIPPISSPSG